LGMWFHEMEMLPMAAVHGSCFIQVVLMQRQLPYSNNTTVALI